MKRSAIIEGPYRYQLARDWSITSALCFVMLNPSTADAEVDDPTIRRCIGFAQREGFGGIKVVNLFAWRATKPANLPPTSEAIGPLNDWHIEQAVRESGRVVVAWGASWPSPSRVNDVLALIRTRGLPTYALGVTLGGHPRHPLYVRADAPLARFTGNA